MAHSAVPPARGLYDPADDKDACGVGFVGELNRQDTRQCVEDALEMLVRMAHRGACGCDANTGKHRPGMSTAAHYALPSTLLLHCNGSGWCELLKATSLGRAQLILHTDNAGHPKPPSWNICIADFDAILQSTGLHVDIFLDTRLPICR